MLLLGTMKGHKISARSFAYQRTRQEEFAPALQSYVFERDEKVTPC
jgi:hypothetical protein